MDLGDRVSKALWEAVDELNAQLPSDRQVTRSLEALLANSVLDSLDIVLLVSGIENGLEDLFDIECPLTEDEALLAEDGPLKTLGTLLEFVTEFVRKRVDE